MKVRWKAIVLESTSKRGDSVDESACVEKAQHELQWQVKVSLDFMLQWSTYIILEGRGGALVIESSVQHGNYNIGQSVGRRGALVIESSMERGNYNIGQSLGRRALVTESSMQHGNYNIGQSKITG